MSEDLRGPRQEIEAEQKKLARLLIVTDRESAEGYPKGSLIPDPEALKKNTEKYRKFLDDCQNVKLRFLSIYDLIAKETDNINTLNLLNRKARMGLENDADRAIRSTLKIAEKLSKYFSGLKDERTYRRTGEYNFDRHIIEVLDSWRSELFETISQERLLYFQKLTAGLEGIVNGKT